MSKNVKKVIIPKTISKYIEEQSRKSKNFRKAYEEEVARVESKYTAKELKAIDTIAEKGKGSGKALKAGKEYSHYLKKSVM